MFKIEIANKVIDDAWNGYELAIKNALVDIMPPFKNKSCGLKTPPHSCSYKQAKGRFISGSGVSELYTPYGLAIVRQDDPSNSAVGARLFRVSDSKNKSVHVTVNIEEFESTSVSEFCAKFKPEFGLLLEGLVE
jgi:hypothetical protein